jgi:hypothetical protein
MSQGEVLPFRPAHRYIATVPQQWGAVVRFEERAGKLLAWTASGNVMILPVNTHQISNLLVDENTKDDPA